MANTRQAEKRARQAEKRRELNVAQRSQMRTSVKKVIKAIQTGDKSEAQTAYREAVSTLDKMVGKGIVHRNASARYKSRLNARIRVMP